MILCSRLNAFCRNLCEKRYIWVSEPHSGEVRGGWWLAGKPMVDFLFALIELFAVYYASGVMRLNVYSSAVFAVGRPLCTEILPEQGHPHQPLLASENQKHWAIRRWRPHPSAFPRFDTIPHCGGQTDGRTDGFAVVCTSSGIAIPFEIVVFALAIVLKGIVNNGYCWWCVLGV